MEPSRPQNPYLTNNTWAGARARECAVAGQPKTPTADHRCRVSGPLGCNALSVGATDLKRWRVEDGERVPQGCPPTHRQTCDRSYASTNLPSRPKHRAACKQLAQR